MKKTLISGSALSMLLLLNGCKKDNPTPVNEEELITTVQLIFQEVGGMSSDTFSFRDIDGVGGIAAVTDSIILKKDTRYIVQTRVLNETTSPADNITEEILEEGTEHQFFYQSTPADFINNFEYLDEDDNGFPIGLEFGCNTKNAAAKGTLRVTLRHEPVKDAANVINNDITNANGETDIEIDFPARWY